MIVSRSGYGKALERKLHSTPNAVSGSGYTGKSIKLIEAVIHVHARLTSGSW